MDTPLVKILLIAAAIAITVGVTVLAWSIFNEGSADVSTDQADRAISDAPGTQADGVRAQISSERACEALGSAHWLQIGGTDSDIVTANTDKDELKDGKFKKVETDGSEVAVGSSDKPFDHPATKVDEGESYCAVGADIRSSSRGLVRRLILWTGSNAGSASWTTYTITG